MFHVECGADVWTILAIQACFHVGLSNPLEHVRTASDTATFHKPTVTWTVCRMMWTHVHLAGRLFAIWAIHDGPPSDRWNRFALLQSLALSATHGWIAHSVTDRSLARGPVTRSAAVNSARHTEVPVIRFSRHERSSPSSALGSVKYAPVDLWRRVRVRLGAWVLSRRRSVQLYQPQATT